MKKYISFLIILFVIVSISSCSKKSSSNDNNNSLLANFSLSDSVIYAGSEINFTDLSTGNPTSWSWSFEGGTPETSSIQNPTNIKYNNAGMFTVALSVSNAYGTDVITKTAYITVTLDPNLPTITTTSINNINATSAKAGGNITSQGASSVIERGLCWNTSTNPTILNSNTKEGIGIGSFTSNIIDLQKNTTYYIRSYATNAYGTAYGNELSFITPSIFSNCGIVTDIDGNIYHTINIGSQCWMVENLKTTRYKDGTNVPYVPSGWTNLPTAAYCYYQNDDTNNITYGKLYNFYAVKTGKLAPEGWHVPSDSEWTILFNYLGGVNLAGGKLKATTLWNINAGTTNSSGFTALPAGVRNINYNTSGSIDFGMGEVCCFWSSSWIQASYSRSSCFKLDQYYTWITQLNDFISFGSGYSVRCVKD